jgi:hypothetical protein
MSEELLDEIHERPSAEYLVRSREYRINETFSMRDARYAEVDSLLRGEWGYSLPGDNAIVEPPMVMNLGLAFVSDVARLTTEQTPVYKAPVFGDDASAILNAQVREVVAETIFTENQGELLVPQFAIDLAVCGAAYTVSWVDGASEYPQFTRVDPRHAYPTIRNGKLYDLLVISVYPGEVADAMFPGNGIFESVEESTIDNEVEIWELYKPGYACRAIARKKKAGGYDKNLVQIIDEAEFPDDLMVANYTQLPTPDGAIRGMLDQLGNSLQAKNKIASLMAKYTEHKVFASWEAKGVLNPNDTPGPNTVYVHDENAPGETFIRRVEPAGSDPALFALMNLLDADQRGGIGYPASRQGEVGQSIASAAFVESTQGQLSSIVKNVQMHEAQLRSATLSTAMRLDREYLDQKKLLARSIGKKTSYIPRIDVKENTKVRVQYGAGSGMSRQNADNRLLNLLGARLIDKGTARDNIEFLRDRSDIQDKIEAENAEDALQQLFWPDPSIPMDIKFRVKKEMQDNGVSLTDAWNTVQEQMKAEQQAQAQEAQAPQPGPEGQPGQPGPEGQPFAPDQADQQALALEKGQQVQEPADIRLPQAPLEQIFVGQ